MNNEICQWIDQHWVIKTTYARIKSDSLDHLKRCIANHIIYSLYDKSAAWRPHVALRLHYIPGTRSFSAPITTSWASAENSSFPVFDFTSSNLQQARIPPDPVKGVVSHKDYEPKGLGTK